MENRTKRIFLLYGKSQKPTHAHKVHRCGTPTFHNHIHARVRHALIEKFIKCELRAKKQKHFALSANALSAEVTMRARERNCLPRETSERERKLNEHFSEKTFLLSLLKFRFERYFFSHFPGFSFSAIFVQLAKCFFFLLRSQPLEFAVCV